MKLVEKIWGRERLDEGLSEVLWHVTTIARALSIMKDDELKGLRLNPKKMGALSKVMAKQLIDDLVSTRGLDRTDLEKYTSVSFARSPATGFTDAVSYVDVDKQDLVFLKMNGRLLRNLGKGFAFQESNIEEDEMEDRLLLGPNKKISPIEKYCHSVHALAEGGSQRLAFLKILQSKCKERNVEFFVHKSFPLSKHTIIPDNEWGKHFEGEGVELNLGSLNLSDQDLRGLDFRWVKANKANFNNANLEGVNFSEGSLSDSTFQGAKMQGCDLSDVYLLSANLMRADLSGAKLYGAVLDGAVFTNANLASADLSYVTAKNIVMHSVNLQFANLSSANLYNAKMIRANLKEANLVKADLLEASLISADFSGADLTGAKLFNANFEGANLTRAKMPDGWQEIIKGNPATLPE